MEPLHLKSESQLYDYFKKFLREKPKAVQLDGSPLARPNSSVVVIFTYSVNSQKYKLLGETTRQAVEAFVRLVEEHGEAGVVLKEYSDKNGDSLILANSDLPGGWACRQYVDKASSRLKKAA